MIKDKLSNSKYYCALSKNLEIGLNWLATTDLKELSDGRYPINGEKIYANVQSYETKEDAKYEAHRNYIDIQYMISGVEKIGVTDIKNCSTCIKYDFEKDIEFLDINCLEEFINLEEGSFLILLPHDAHKPSIMKEQKMQVKKVVVKVACK